MLLCAVEYFNSAKEQTCKYTSSVYPFPSFSFALLKCCEMVEAREQREKASRLTHATFMVL